MQVDPQNQPPSLPTVVSNDGREIWQWGADMGAFLQRESKIKELRFDIKICGTRCGDCDKWMKSSVCPRERPGTGKRAGYSVGPSMNGEKCCSYVEKPETTERRTKLEQELKSLLPSNS